MFGRHLTPWDDYRFEETELRKTVKVSNGDQAEQKTAPSERDENGNSKSHGVRIDVRDIAWPQLKRKVRAVDILLQFNADRRRSCMA